MTVFFSPDLMPLDDCKLLFVHEVFDVEKAGSQLNEFDEGVDSKASPVKRKYCNLYYDPVIVYFFRA